MPQTEILGTRIGREVKIDILPLNVGCGSDFGLKDAKYRCDPLLPVEDIINGVVGIAIWGEGNGPGCRSCFNCSLIATAAASRMDSLCRCCP